MKELNYQGSLVAPAGHRRSRITRAGFTLIEFIGVLIIISIILAAAAPVAVQLIQNQRQLSEERALPGIGQALKRGILREQSFPLDNSSVSAETDDQAWWKIASRSGAGGEMEVRYPRGSFVVGDTDRHLYLAQTDWAGKTFFEVTGGGPAWLDDFNEPDELRMLLLSVVDPDLPLPEALSEGDEGAFNKLWSSWSVGLDGNPSSGEWATYGLSAAEWEGRAAELNIERIDLRDLLCRVVIENRRHLSAFYEEGELIRMFEIQEQTFLANPAPVFGTYNLQDTRLQLALETVVPAEGETVSVDKVLVDKLYIIQAGRLIDESKPAGYIISGQEMDTSGSITTVAPVRVQIYPADGDSRRAQIALNNPADPEFPAWLNGWETTDAAIQERYFLKLQALLLEDPSTGNEAGVFIVKDSFEMLRYDGLRWEY
jgi:prepilin-type N-terminal cleavage/methylation domain-containing protein